MRKNAAGTVIGSTTYYPAAGAMRVDGTLYYVLKDQLGSASVVLDASGNMVGEQRYYPFGETRLSTGNMFTDRLYTGQRELTGLGLYNYNARFYSPKLGRFIQADTIVPGAGNPQAYNRYSYVLNNPIKFNDPSGHMQVEYYKGAYLSISQMNKLFSTQRSSTMSKTPTVIPTAPKTSTPTSSTPTPTSTPTSSTSGGSSILPKIGSAGVVALDYYMVEWSNFGSAWTTIKNPNASALEKVGSGLYMTAWGGAHLSLAVGLAGLGCAATGPGCVAAVEGAVGIGGAASADGDPTNEVQGLVEGAKQLYPKLAELPEQMHHIFPKYLGGDINGATRALNPAYHQLITNAFRQEWAYGQQIRPSLEQAQEIIQRVYSQFPLPPP